MRAEELREAVERLTRSPRRVKGPIQIPDGPSVYLRFLTRGERKTIDVQTIDAKGNLLKDGSEVLQRELLRLTLASESGVAIFADLSPAEFTKVLNDLPADITEELTREAFECAGYKTPIEARAKNSGTTPEDDSK